MNINSNYNNFTLRNFGNRPNREGIANLSERTISSAMQHSVRVDISDEARKLAASILAVNEHDGVRQEQTPLGLVEAKGFNELWFFSQARHFMSETFENILTAENAPMAEMGARILGSADVFVFGSHAPPPNHAHNLAAMANEYAAIRQELTEQFSGEELERRLEMLSEAFELSAQIHANDAQTHARIQMSFEYFKMQAHNYITANRDRMLNPPHLFDAEILDKVEARNTTIAVADAIRNSIIHLANLTRQFVMENGKIDLSQLGELNSFLSNSDSAEGGLSFDTLNDVSRIIAQPRNLGRSETQFDQLARAISR